MMDRWREALEKIRFSLRKKELDRDLDAELAAHLDLATSEYVRQGMPAHGARRKAMIALGGLEQTKEEHRDARGLQAMETMMQDLRYTMRTLRLIN